ncbi:MAG: cell envelope biogenesis protein TolA [Pseudomonadota bacterium]
MVVKFLSKYILEVIPSVVATVVGAYIVTHYINAKPDADKPKAEVAAPANTAKGAKASEPAKTVEAPPKAAKTEAAKAEPEPASKPAEKSSETASAPAELRRQPPIREKAAAKPVVAAPAEAKAEDTRDANEIAREAIARLRSSDPAQPDVPRAQQAARPPERLSVNVVSAPAQPQVQAPAAIQPLPPATNVVPPPTEVTAAPAPQPIVRADGSFRPMPPADIPTRPLDIHAKERTSVAEDVVSTAKSVLHAVIPGTN